jgi:hypothetical protein
MAILEFRSCFELQLLVRLSEVTSQRTSPEQEVDR